MFKKKIIQVIDILEQGGAQQYLLDLLRELKKDFNFLVLAFKGGPVQKKIKDLGIEVKILGIDSQKIGLFYFSNTKKTLFWLKKYFQEYKPDIIQTHLLGADIWGRISAPKRAKIIQTIHSADSFRGNFLSRQGLKNMFFDKLLFGRTDLIIAVSQAAGQSILREGFNKSKIKVIYSGINRSKFLPQDSMRQAVRLAWGLSKQDLAIVSVGRLNPVKGFDILIKAFANIAAKYQNIKLYIIGGGPEEEKLKKNIRNLNLRKRVFLLGERDDVNKLLNGTDIFVLPSREESRALVLLEAATNKKAIIASNVGGIPEFIKHRKNGLLFQSLNHNDLAKKIEILIKNQKLRTGLAEQAFINSKIYTISSMAEKYKKIYHSL